MMRKLLALPIIYLLLCCFHVDLNAQEQQTILITRSYDTMRVQLKCKKDWLQHPIHLLEKSALKVRTTEESSYKKIGLDSILFISFHGRQFQEMEGEIFGHKLFLQEDSGRIILWSAFEHQFWPAGNFDLVKRKYQYLIQKDTTVYFAQRDLSITFFKTLYRPYVYSNSRFVELCKILFWDDPELLVKVVDGEEGYHYADFPKIVKEYNRRQG
jgi:hypothetical protein